MTPFRHYKRVRPKTDHTVFDVYTLSFGRFSNVCLKRCHTGVS